MTSMHVGKYKKPHAESTIAVSSNNCTAINSEISGQHKVGVAVGCSSSDCKHFNCAETSAEVNPCKVSPEIHQKSLQEIAKNHKQFSYEFVGVFTHKVPEGKPGVMLSKLVPNFL